MINHDDCEVLMCENGHLSIVKYLINLKAEYGKIDIHADDEYAFRWACENGHLKVVEFLMSWGLNVDDIRSDDNYALHYACQKGHLYVVELLMSYGLNIDDIRRLLINPIDRKYKKRFTIKIGQHIKIIHVDEIECFYSENKATYIHTNGNRNYLIDGSLEHWEDQLDPEQFYRVNRTYIIHINAIKDIVAYTNSRLKLILHSYSESEIIVSRERVKDFKNWIDR